MQQLTATLCPGPSGWPAWFLAISERGWARGGTENLVAQRGAAAWLEKELLHSQGLVVSAGSVSFLDTLLGHQVA